MNEIMIIYRKFVAIYRQQLIALRYKVVDGNGLKDAPDAVALMELYC